MAVKKKSSAKAGSKSRAKATATAPAKVRPAAEPNTAVLWMAVLFTALCIVFVIAATWRYA